MASSLNSLELELNTPGAISAYFRGILHNISLEKMTENAKEIDRYHSFAMSVLYICKCRGKFSYIHSCLLYSGGIFTLLSSAFFEENSLFLVGEPKGFNEKVEVKIIAKAHPPNLKIMPWMRTRNSKAYEEGAFSLISQKIDVSNIYIR
ncbi:hypothetical protein [Brevibacillus laterosporus]|uniref:hypothetical protein n=1 Tax=Brevibacillus laterosporus TaxID=1465 RepID=UPI002656EAAF|nr:hypothetical protein [Brevibacillus laterosporus]MDN9011998.1 hypothetical protein [Brevibacillus laterosporus]MDO0943094.1 hypothetical protein [Brevibacillus laterosporus]